MKTLDLVLTRTEFVAKSQKDQDENGRELIAAARGYVPVTAVWEIDTHPAKP
jgi:hypothetical protein